MVIRPPTGGGLLAVEGWEGRCAPRHLAQAGGNSGSFGRPADEVRFTGALYVPGSGAPRSLNSPGPASRKVVMFSSFNVSFHRRQGGRPAHGGVPVSRPIRQSHRGVRRCAASAQGCRERRPGKWTHCASRNTAELRRTAEGACTSP